MLFECPDPDECALLMDTTMGMEEYKEENKKLKDKIRLWDKILDTAMKCNNIPSGTMQALEFLQGEIKEAIKLLERGTENGQ